MKTIELISKVNNEMMNFRLDSEFKTGTFVVKNDRVIFQLQCRPSHFQTLLNMGVTIFFETAVMSGLSPKALRFKSGREAIKQGDWAPYYYMGNPENAQTGVIGNILDLKASCSVKTLELLDKYCRDNHEHHLSIHNNTALRVAGWQFKEHYSSQIPIESQYINIKAIRRTTIGKPASALLPIQKRVLNLK